jgi:hypothetical protein
MGLLQRISQVVLSRFKPLRACSRFLNSAPVSSSRQERVISMREPGNLDTCN